MRVVSFLFVLAALFAFSPVIQTDAASGQPQSVTGTGFTSEGGVISYRTSIAAIKLASGNVNGSMTTDLDLSVVAPEIGRVHFSADVSCVEVDGQEAWVGGTIRHSTFAGFEGIPVIVYVKDGGNKADSLHGAFVDGEEVPADATCEDKPFLEPNPVTQGNFKVR